MVATRDVVVGEILLNVCHFVRKKFFSWA